jgi:hypothetical protein
MGMTGASKGVFCEEERKTDRILTDKFTGRLVD